MVARRTVLRGAGILAGALALPSSIQTAVEAFEAQPAVDLFCPTCRLRQQREGRAPAELASRLYNELHAQLTTAQQDLLMHLSDAWNDEDTEEQARFVGEIGRHMPGLRPVVWMIAEHLWQQRIDEQGVCCEET